MAKKVRTRHPKPATTVVQPIQQVPLMQEPPKSFSTFKAAILAFIIIGVLSYAVNGVLLQPMWIALQAAGVVRGDMQSGTLIYFALVLVLSIVIARIVRHSKIEWAGTALALGFKLGLVLCFMEWSAFLFYRLPLIVPIAGSVIDLVALMFATWAAWRVNKGCV